MKFISWYIYIPRNLKTQLSLLVFPSRVLSSSLCTALPCFPNSHFSRFRVASTCLLNSLEDLQPEITLLLVSSNNEMNASHVTEVIASISRILHWACREDMMKIVDSTVVFVPPPPPDGIELLCPLQFWISHQHLVIVALEPGGLWGAGAPIIF